MPLLLLRPPRHARSLTSDMISAVTDDRIRQAPRKFFRKSWPGRVQRSDRFVRTSRFSLERRHRDPLQLSRR